MPTITVLLALLCTFNSSANARPTEIATSTSAIQTPTGQILVRSKRTSFYELEKEDKDIKKSIENVIAMIKDNNIVTTERIEANGKQIKIIWISFFSSKALYFFFIILKRYFVVSSRRKLRQLRKIETATQTAATNTKKRTARTEELEMTVTNLHARRISMPDINSLARRISMADMNSLEDLR